MGIINSKFRGAIFVFALTLVLVAALNWTKYKINFPAIKEDPGTINISSVAAVPTEGKSESHAFSAASPERSIESKGASHIVLESSIRDWERARGHLTSSDTAVYETYSDGVLVDLGNKNDLKALEVLRRRMLENNNVNETVRYSQMAVALGSTVALASLSRLVFVLNPSAGDSKKSRALALEAIAVTELIELRGDLALARDSKRLLSKNYDVDLNLTAEEKKYVDMRAKESYDKYQDIRNARGLGAFDNSTSSTLFGEK